MSMIEIADHYFFDSSALLDRLSNGVRVSTKEVVFVVGAPLTAPYGGNPGVDDVNAVIQLIRDEFSAESENLRRLDADIHASDNRYQAAFRFLQGRRGQDTANEVIRKAVLNAHNGLRSERNDVARWPDAQLAPLEESIGEWDLSPGVAALGELLAIKDTPFGKLAITSNFDPLVEIATRAAGGKSWRTSLHVDGDFSLSQAPGCQVLHIHGHWQGTDTLHTGNQLLQTRPFLKNALLRYMQDKLVVVIAYGGWQDIFTGALQSLVSDPSTYPEVLWAFYEQAPELNSYLRSVLTPGLDRNRVTLYGGVDCHAFFPELLNRWKTSPTAPERLPFSARPSAAPETPIRLRSSESDRPPNIEVWVGREAEVRALEASSAKVVIVSGIGGQGKSTLAAHYLRLVSEGGTQYTHWDWRDCKEEGDRIRTQLLAAIERISLNSLSAETLGAASDADIVEAFISVAEDTACVFVFDNVDSYVDLVNEVFIGILDKLVRKFSRSATKSRIIITCRPRAAYDIVSIITIPLTGLTLKETVELFDQRTGRGKTNSAQIETAHSMTEGHAFWLDMMAVQVGRAPGVTLKSILEDTRRGREGPTNLLASIWKTLPEREKVVLRAMAETMRPEDEDLIADVVSGKLNFKNFKKALKSLVNLNLVLVKPERNSPDLFDLHPLVRQFVRLTFDRRDRLGFIKIVLVQYGNIIKGIGSALGVHLPLSLLERWSQKAELEIEAGMLVDALETLASAYDALIGGGHTEEFVRVARKLFQTNNWADLRELPKFDGVCAAMISGLSDLEEFSDVDDMLQKYEQTISIKTARYIKFCDIKSHYLWQRKKFDEAIEWATKGDDLKKSSHVDTLYDCEHNLALARRDGGDPGKALEYFTRNSSLEVMLDPDDTSIESASLLGNTGRCLQLMGRLDEALTCLKKSARILETDGSAHRLGNQAFARQWIGEVFRTKGDRDTAFLFFCDAEQLVIKAFPGRARELRSAIEILFQGEPLPSISPADTQRRVSRWIQGRNNWNGHAIA
ncbi:SIR2 family protein [Rhizobium sp. G21]|uniref:SIR2 family protein n=1 Tax=Rhizobium sp. G21 TaxID=2758439 RepID=UPI0016023B5A|nr:SIR2 family protein [Rhizobium sp. G21]MBB1248295.1 hypothetical protein [Rhizobium sp. G21]